MLMVECEFLKALIPLDGPFKLNGSLQPIKDDSQDGVEHQHGEPSKVKEVSDDPFNIYGLLTTITKQDQRFVNHYPFPSGIIPANDIPTVIKIAQRFSRVRRTDRTKQTLFSPVGEASLFIGSHKGEEIIIGSKEIVMVFPMNCLSLNLQGPVIRGYKGMDQVGLLGKFRICSEESNGNSPVQKETANAEKGNSNHGWAHQGDSLMRIIFPAGVDSNKIKNINPRACRDQMQKAKIQLGLLRSKALWLNEEWVDEANRFKEEFRSYLLMVPKHGCESLSLNVQVPRLASLLDRF
ncbi:hypothetical protein Tco_1524106 [Tanacetum coccineum]